MKKLKNFKSFNEAVDNPFDDDYVSGEEYSETPEVELDADEEVVEKSPVSFEEAKAWILENYDEDRVIEILDDIRHEYVDLEQMEEEGYENEYDYYMDYGTGEAETHVVEDIVADLERNHHLQFDKLDEDTNIYEFLRNIFDCLKY